MSDKEILAGALELLGAGIVGALLVFAFVAAILIAGAGMNALP